MTLLPPKIHASLVHNAHRQEPVKGTDAEIDFVPVVRLFTPDGAATWLLTELDPEDQDTAFGLCDLGMGFPELGSVSLAELEGVRGPLGLSVEVDQHFQPTRTLFVLEAMLLMASLTASLPHKRQRGETSIPWGNWPLAIQAKSVEREIGRMPSGLWI